MSHAIPNLSVNPIYTLLWVLLGVWLLVIALITWWHFRRAQLNQPIDPSPWQVSRAEPLLIEGAVIRRDEEPTPLVLAEPAPVHRVA